MIKPQQKFALYLLLYLALSSIAFAQVVDIPDSNLAQVIREELALPAGAEITVQDLNGLTILEAVNSDIRNLSGLEHAANLEHLEVWGNSISDLTPIANLKGLKALDAGDCLIDDITPVANLTMLTRLLLGDNRIRDISSVAKLANLTHLRLNDNQISDIEPLANLTQLMFLRLSDNRIINIGPLADLALLSELEINHNEIVEIMPLANLAQLTHLRLHNNRIEDIGPLANLTNLIHLELQNNQIIDSTPLAKLTSLEYLDTNNNPIFDPGSPFVEIPDPNLREAVQEALNTPITQAAMKRLTRLDASNRGVTDLTGLEFATELTELSIYHNPIMNLAPIAGLMKLEVLFMWGLPTPDLSLLSDLTNLKHLNAGGCQIVDISPLSNLRQLNRLNLGDNQITDITPLAELTQLKKLYLTRNHITDVSPMAGLTELEVLEIGINLINDHSPLDNLSLDLFSYDQFCEMPPIPLEPRLQNRSYPSVFAANWIFGPDPRIDLIYGPGVLGMHLRSDGRLAGSMEHAVQQRDELIAINPNMAFLIEVKMRSEEIGKFGEDWPYWIRDGAGNIVGDYKKGIGLVDFTHPDIQNFIVDQATAVAKCGLFDGIVFDSYRDFDPVLPFHLVDLETQQEARNAILQRIRDETRSNFLIQVNSNWYKIPLTGPYINGLSMETGIPDWYLNDPKRQDPIGDLNSILLETESTLLWAEENLRPPRINGVAGEALVLRRADSPEDRRWVRVLTTLSLTHADGYVNYQVHDQDKDLSLIHAGKFVVDQDRGFWYDFLKADLGHPVGPKVQLYDEDISGLYIREYTKGWAVYNNSGESQVITLPEETQGVASGSVGTEHTLPNLDGEMYLRVKPKNPADVNRDGAVNILDLVMVAANLSQTGENGADVNKDGVVNILDLVQVAGALGGGGAAPSAYSLDLSMISAADVERWLALAQESDIGDANFQRGDPLPPTVACGVDAERDGAVAELPEPLQSGDVDTVSSRARGRGVDYDL